jgi:hypothetical protein
MQDNKNVAIGVLSVTGCVLLVGVIVSGILAPEPAMAIGQTDRGGDYIVVTGQFTDSSEVIYVTDAAANRLNMYSFEWNRDQFVLWDTHDLQRTLGRARQVEERR